MRKVNAERDEVDKKVAEATEALDKARKEAEELGKQAEETGDAKDQRKAGDAQFQVGRCEVALEDAKYPLGQIEARTSALKTRIREHVATLESVPRQLAAVQRELNVLRTSSLAAIEKPFRLYVVKAVQDAPILRHPHKQAQRDNYLRKGEEVVGFPTGSSWYVFVLTDHRIVWAEATMFRQVKAYWPEEGTSNRRIKGKTPSITSDIFTR